MTVMKLFALVVIFCSIVTIIAVASPRFRDVLFLIRKGKT